MLAWILDNLAFLIAVAIVITITVLMIVDIIKSAPYIDDEWGL